MACFMYAAHIRQAEERAVQSDVSYLQLMENAGKETAAYLLDRVMNEQKRVLILCGVGNNGGDGYVVARHLAEAYPNISVQVLAVGGKPKTDIALRMYERCAAFDKIAITEFFESSSLDVIDFRPDVVVDAIYGIGFHGSLPSYIASLFDYLKSFSPFVLAADIPSGMCADDDTFDKSILPADVTVTFSSAKRCMILEKTKPLCGEVEVVSVGIEESVLNEYRIDLQASVNQADFLLLRKQDSHKGTYGQVFALCGSYGMAGAAMLCGKAALRCGVGLVHMLIPETIYPIVASQLWEAVYHPLEETDDHGLILSSLETVADRISQKPNSVLVCGPGLSSHKQTQEYIRALLPKLTVPIVLDADGLNAFKGHIHEWKAMSENGSNLVITPHPAEASRLLGCTVEEVEADRIFTAKRLAVLSGAVVVLKGHRTVVADNATHVCVNKTGCSGLAKGGSGDVLAGMIASFIAQGIDPFRACTVAVYLHGLASEMTASRLSESGMLPTDLLDDLPILLSQFEKRE